MARDPDRHYYGEDLRTVRGVITPGFGEGNGSFSLPPIDKYGGAKGSKGFNPGIMFLSGDLAMAFSGTC